MPRRKNPYPNECIATGAKKMRLQFQLCLYIDRKERCVRGQPGELGRGEKFLRNVDAQAEKFLRDVDAGLD
jgi:hypothetical protein